MQLSYRGIPYNYDPCTIETIESDLTVRFLGTKYQIRRPVDPIVATRQNLTYRGATY